MWGIIFGTGGVVLALSVIFLWTRFCRFGIVQKIAGDRKWHRRLLGMIPLAVFGIFLVLNLVNTAIVMIHMTVYWLIAELIWLVIRKIRQRKTKKEEAGESGAEAEASGRKFRPYWLGIIVLCIELCYFSVGWYCAHRVWETDYHLTTDKDLGTGRLRIAQIADSHIGTTFDGKGFAEHLKTIEATEPDILVITGDFVDDSTTMEDMYEACLGLAGFKCTYGIYYVYGNHDKGYFSHKNFTAEQLEEALTAAGVVVMKDGVELVDNRFYIIGRRDYSMSDRTDIGTITSLLDPSKYTIVLDHQPRDYAAEAAAGVDLVLSGHTHGGQMLEIRWVGEMIGANDRTYGMEVRDGTTFIVTSGISDWSIRFKTGTVSEFCIIDVEKE